MTKKLYTLLGLLMFLGANAQETLPIYTDYLTDNLYLVHPSMAGASNCAKLRLTGRKQWFGENDAPALNTLSFNGKFSENGPSAGGIILFNDKNGYHKQDGVYLTYAHHIMLGRNTIDLNMLSFGLSAVMVQSSIDQSEFVDLTGGDPALLGDKSATYFNFDLGASYHLLDFYAHFTVKNLLGSGRDLYTGIESSDISRFVFSMGYVFSQLNSDWSVEPSMMFHHVVATHETQFDLNMKVYKKMNFGKVWGGLSYRRSLDGAEYATGSGSAEAQKLQYITPFMGVNYKQYMFGYTYSYQTGQLKLVDGGYHQLSLGMNVFCGPEKYDCNCPGIN